MLFYLGLCHNVSISAGDVFKMTPGLYLYIDAMCIIVFFFVCVLSLTADSNWGDMKQLEAHSGRAGTRVTRTHLVRSGYFDNVRNLQTHVWHINCFFVFFFFDLNIIVGNSFDLLNDTNSNIHIGQISEEIACPYLIKMRRTLPRVERTNSQHSY